MIYYLFCFFIIIIFINFAINHKTIIFYVIFSEKGKGGPKSLSQYIHKAIKIWSRTTKLNELGLLIPKDKIDISIINQVAKNRNTFIWLQRSSYINLIYNKSYNKIFSKVLYGPNVTPLNWFGILNDTYETFWCDIMKKIYGYVVHTDRVKKQIMKNTRCSSFGYKYYFLKPCIQIKFNINRINHYYDRIIDFLIYIKYVDSNRTINENILCQYLKRKYVIKIVKYGNHTRESLLDLANHSKYVIYFSFYDTGALALLEMKLMGIWPISHQSEFINKGYGSFVKDLDNNIYNSLTTLDSIYKIKYSPRILANYVYNKLSCIESLKQLIIDLKKKY